MQFEINELETKREKPKSYVSFVDIENALEKFSGDNEYNISKWTREFEKITAVMECTAAEQFVFARRMMTGSASLFLRSSKATTWNELKAELTGEFKRTTGVKEALKTLEERKWERQAESLHRYVLIMQELAEEPPINEAELIEFIVEGMRDKTPATAMFLNVTSLEVFKRNIPRYEKLVRERSQRRWAAGTK